MRTTKKRCLWAIYTFIYTEIGEIKKELENRWGDIEDPKRSDEFFYTFVNSHKLLNKAEFRALYYRI